MGRKGHESEMWVTAEVTAENRATCGTMREIVGNFRSKAVGAAINNRLGHVWSTAAGARERGKGDSSPALAINMGLLRVDKMV